MSDQGVENGCQMLLYGRNLKHGLGIGVETLFALVGDDDRCGFVSFEYGSVFNNITDHRISGSRCADNNQGLRRQIDVFLIFHKIR